MNHHEVTHESTNFFLAPPPSPRSPPLKSPSALSDAPARNSPSSAWAVRASTCIPFDDGAALVRRAYDLGINYFDMARSYWNGRAEEVYGAAIPPFRKNIFLTSKSGVRTRQGAEAELETSLRLMKTDYLDLWQMHGVNTKEDIQKILAPGRRARSLRRGEEGRQVPLHRLHRPRRPRLQPRDAAQLRRLRHHADAPPRRRHRLPQLRESSAARPPSSAASASSA